MQQRPSTTPEAPRAEIPTFPEGSFSRLGIRRRSPHPRSRWRVLAFPLVALLALASYTEMRSAAAEAWLFSQLASHLRARLAPGPTRQVRYPRWGPYDARLGYRALPERLARLRSRGYRVLAQARFSPALLQTTAWGLPPPYSEKRRAGLRILGQRAEPLFERRFPQSAFARLADVPAPLVSALLFLENRELLGPGSPWRNPALEWDRLAYAVGIGVAGVGPGHRPGGSTLATQLQKYRHWPEGRTRSPLDKLHQMLAASLAGYRSGPNTLTARRQIVLDYLDSVPLAAAPGFGEVHGVLEGLRVWYGTSQATLRTGLGPQAPLAERGRLLAQAVSLMVAQRRPSALLLNDPAALQRATDRTLQHLAQAGVIPAALCQAARAHPPRPRSARPEALFSPTRDKAAQSLRLDLLPLLGVSRLYDLDRLDLEVAATLDTHTQHQVEETLSALTTPAGARAAGLYGRHLLHPGDDPARVLYSFVLLERNEGSNAVRVEADTFPGPFSVDRQAKLDLGSTAKLRTLALYLQVVADLRKRFASLPPGSLATQKGPVSASEPLWATEDPLTSFVRHEMAAHPKPSLPELLDAALERRYSASPRERFWTGGAWQRFSNFDARDDVRTLSVREAFRRSVNLPFIRVMRDLVRHEIAGPGGVLEALSHEGPDADALDRQLLARFAAREGATYVRRFAARLRRARPDRAQAPRRPPSANPLERFVAGWLRRHPRAMTAALLHASEGARLKAYAWLFRTRHRDAKERRIQEELERAAFRRIHKRWARLGYPFPTLVPSLATAIGASADRPLALAELLGVIQNDGRQLPTRRVRRLHFAAQTPYDVLLAPRPAPALPWLRPQVARALRRELLAVVETGTGRRAAGLFAGLLPEAQAARLPVGGKTGTGDLRYPRHGPAGQSLPARVAGRTATFAFFLGERHFGVLTAYVPGPVAAGYHFTSALATQALRTLAPRLVPLVAGTRAAATTIASTSAQRD